MRNVVVILMSALMMATTAGADNYKSRTMEFNYEVAFKNIPQDAKELKVWLPMLPQTDYQMVEVVSIKPGSMADITEDKVYGNKILNFTHSLPLDQDPSIKVHYRVKRLEYANKFDGDRKRVSVERQEDLSKFLKVNQLGQLTPEFKTKALEITKGKESTLGKARAIYDYVFENVRYNKTIPGWGQGDTARVCNLKAGNCTDFHSLFISIARENGIPAKFVIGVPFKPNVREGQVVGYHCWAEFYDERSGWVPVDISEASKDKTKYEYHFGSIDENRLEFSQGRDIMLQPQQAGEPLNYFVYPYAEVDGKIFKGVGVLFRFRDSPQVEELTKQWEETK